jgi:bifunctional non-homologous end joining protein LigD
LPPGKTAHVVAPPPMRDDTGVMDVQAEPGDVGGSPVPLTPMWPVIGSLPGVDREAEFAFEPLWNGARVLVHLPGDGTLLLRGGTCGIDVTGLYPELEHLPELLPDGLEAVLDGEIVAPDPDTGRPTSVARIQERMSLRHPGAIAHALGELPVQLVLYDVLYLGNEPTLRQPYTARRALLDDLDITGPHVLMPAYWPAMAREAFHYNLQEGFDGVVAKRLTSVYKPGRRSTEWIRVKHLAPTWSPGT